MAQQDHDHIEVTLARDLAVGPKGGVRKADTSIVLPAVEAQNLLIRGQARLTHPDKVKAAVGGAAAVTLPEEATGGAAPEDKSK